MGFFNDDRLAGQLKSSVGLELGFGTAIGSANSNFGWSSLGKPARLPGAVNSLARSAECRPAHRNPAQLRVCVYGARLLAHTCGNPPPPFLKLASKLPPTMRLAPWPYCGRRAGGGTAGPAGPPGSLIAVCVASVCGPSVRPGKSLAFCFFWNARA